MKQLILSISIGILFSMNAISQENTFEREFESIKTDLVKWDVVRGEWLSNSILAISQNKTIPTRTFPEVFTPYEMMTMLPQDQKERIRTTISNERKVSNNKEQWNFIDEFFARPTCTTSSGRSFGDPHFSSFDGNFFSLQSVGEFTLAKSKSGFVNVQARQTANGDDFALNTAVAMNVGGDRVCFYANEKPDSDISTPIRLDGKPIKASLRPYFLPHGGIITCKGNEYVVNWPTGEKVSLNIRSNGRFGTINISTLVFPCVMEGYEGLLGNANGIAKDDLSTRGKNQPDLYASMEKYRVIFGNTSISEAANRGEKDYLERLTKDFGDSWRINDMTTLFDYAPGENTTSFTDYSFPKNHKTIGDLNQNQRVKAQRVCEEQGVRGDELKGCIYDNAYLNIPPSPRPDFEDNTKGVVLRDVPKVIEKDQHTFENVNDKKIDNNQVEQGKTKEGSNEKPQIQNKPEEDNSMKTNTHSSEPVIVEDTPKDKGVLKNGGKVFGEVILNSPSTKPSGKPSSDQPVIINKKDGGSVISEPIKKSGTVIAPTQSKSGF